MKVLIVLFLVLFAPTVSAAGCRQGKGKLKGKFNEQGITGEAAGGVITHEYLVMYEET
jgi:hypothetical protein